MRWHVVALALGASAAAFLGTQPVWGQTRTPLLIEGKKTLYQRVLTRPDATLAGKPGEAGGKSLAPFSAFFVYERVQAGGANWLLIGASANGKTDGYVKEVDTVPWRHAMTLEFANPTNRERVLFFKERTALEAFAKAEDAGSQAEKLRKEIAAKSALPKDSPVIAIEPENWVDPKKQFYLLPILEAHTAPVKGFRVRLVKVASITRDKGGNPAAGGNNAGITNFNSAVTFVIDATSSMQPYIDRARTAMEEVLRQADEAKVGDRVRFGLVAFQDDPAKTKGVDYLSKVFADPGKATREQFLAEMTQLRATKASTRAFAEDSYAGIDQALRQIGWKSFGGRYIVFITDASAREGNSPLASTRLSTDQIRTNAQELGVAIYALHLKTPEGNKDHTVAEAQFKRLTNWPGKGPLYFPVEAGDPAKFEADVKRMAQLLVEQVKNPERTLKPGASDPKRDAMDDAVGAVGRAMVLAYLGREQGVKAPSMYEAWASQRDFAKPDISGMSVRVLLTKNQLSDLQTTLRKLVEAGEKAQINPADFFNQLRSAAVAMGRDPSRLGQGGAKNLEQSGLMGEYLDGLPYQSNLMTIDQDTWARMAVGQQQAIIDDVKAKIALYQRFHDDVDRWVKLNDAAGDGDRVYPVPIDALP